MRVALDGGVSEAVPGNGIANALELMGGIGLSRDGKHLVVYATTNDVSRKDTVASKLVIIDFDAARDSLPRFISPDPRIAASLISGGPKFTADGNALTYAITDDGAWSLWVQPLDARRGGF
jgi:hypothetical protein